jgi:hypothetical protein
MNQMNNVPFLFIELLNVDANDIVSAICTIDSNSFQLPSKSTGKPMTGIYIKEGFFFFNYYLNKIHSIN